MQTSDFLRITKVVMRAIMKSSFVEKTICLLAQVLDAVLGQQDNCMQTLQKAFEILGLPFDRAAAADAGFLQCFSGTEGEPS
jgi:hypothetical protein